MSLIDLAAEAEARTSDSPGLASTRGQSSSASGYWDTRNLTAAQAADLHAALSSLPKSFSSQMSQYAAAAQLSGQAASAYSSNSAMAAAFGLGSGSGVKDRSALLSHDRDILRGDRDLFNRDRQSEYYNTKQLYDNLGSLYSQSLPPGSSLSQSPGPGSPMSVSPSSMMMPGGAGPSFNSSKYTQLLAVIEEIGKDIRPTYAGNKSSAERLKRGIVHARILVREALMEAERSARQ